MIALALLTLPSAATLHLFFLPRTGLPSHADAVAVLGGPGQRIAAADNIVLEGHSSTLLISVPDVNHCYKPIRGVKIICFRPRPFTTQGEARYIAAAARSHGWKHLIVVTSTEQSTRARLRIERCTKVDVGYVATPAPVGRVPYEVAYEWAALFKALVLQRGC